MNDLIPTAPTPSGRHREVPTRVRLHLGLIGVALGIGVVALMILGIALVAGVVGRGDTAARKSSQQAAAESSRPTQIPTGMTGLITLGGGPVGTAKATASPPKSSRTTRRPSSSANVTGASTSVSPRPTNESSEPSTFPTVITTKPGPPRPTKTWSPWPTPSPSPTKTHGPKPR